MRKLIADFKLAWKMVVAVFLTVLRIRRARRKLMFFVTLVTMFVAFLGITLLESFLSEHLFLFAIYWFFCAGLVLFMLLLAIYDFAAVKGEFNQRSDKELAEALKDIEQSARDSQKDINKDS